MSRAEHRPILDVWPLRLQVPILPVPVPLCRPDPDVILNLGAALQQIYRNARYERRIDYRDAPPVPDLTSDDAAWLDARLRERGLRP